MVPASSFDFIPEHWGMPPSMKPAVAVAGASSGKAKLGSDESSIFMGSCAKLLTGQKAMVAARAAVDMCKSTKPPMTARTTITARGTTTAASGGAAEPAATEVPTIARLGAQLATRIVEAAEATAVAGAVAAQQAVPAKANTQEVKKRDELDSNSSFARTLWNVTRPDDLLLASTVLREESTR
jgi:hypothetical protein